ncbi:MAG TPA: efflux RND transporter permease subunit [Vicinamibacteria bacterium]|nr:efflux RND transporter permease subunit [Vicinamibacteria bacterium]
MTLPRAAMRRPVTVVVAMAALVLAGLLAIRQMPRDILPNLGVPVIYVAQPYGGMDPAQMEGFLTYYYEYHFLYVTGIEHVESRSIQGVALLKLQFHPGTNMAQAIAETINYANRARAFMPPGTVPPFIMRFDAGSVPVGDLVFASERRSVGEIQDLALNRVRPLFATLPGVSAPPPFGASQRSIVVRVDPERLRAYEMSPDEVVAAVAATNTISPSGNIRIGEMIPIVPLNSVVKRVSELEGVPIRAGYPTVFVRDVATVEDGTDIATGYALVNGRRTVYIPVTKRADASTLEVVRLVKGSLAKFQAVLPDDVKVTYEFDQSPYVTRAIDGLVLEGSLGALLTGLMVLLFLRDGRSAFIVVVTIPFSLLAATVGLWLTGQTVNIMTLGGLALAVGVLVDEATVAIENVHTHLARGRSVRRAALTGTEETTGPRLLAMLSILAVFIPSFFMAGAGRALFVPISLAVGFSMLASYLLSNTLIPIAAVWLFRRAHGEAAGASAFDVFGTRFAGLLGRVSGRPGWLLVAYLAGAGVIIGVVGSLLGVEIFPGVDVGQFQLRLRAPAGTRIERTEKLTLEALKLVADEVGPQNVESTLGFVGIQPPSYPINTIFLWTGGPEESVSQVQLRPGAAAIEPLQERLRRTFAARLPDVRVSFEPSDIVSRVMSLGATTPVEVAVSSPSLPLTRETAEKLRGRLAAIPSLRDLQFGQSLDYPSIEVRLDREKAGILGVKTADVSRALAAATSSSRFTAPVFWADPSSGVAYQVQVEVPESQMTSADDLRNMPMTAREGRPVLLQNIATVSRGTMVGEYDRYNMQRTITLSANVSGEDLGRLSAHLADAVSGLGSLPAKLTVAVRGQIAALEQVLGGLRTGLVLAIVVIFLLLAANFQSLRLSLAVVSTAPAVIAGVALCLWITRTTLNVQSFMGAIMAIGVATANAILLVTFAERARQAGTPAAEAGVEAARDRLRPILMTSAAMIAGMIPMAVGLGEGGEQTAPLGRAVIGGLAAATVATLTVLPSVFAVLQSRQPVGSGSLEPDDGDVR